MIPPGDARYNLTVDWRDHRRCRRPVGQTIMARLSSWQLRARRDAQRPYVKEPWSPDRR